MKDSFIRVSFAVWKTVLLVLLVCIPIQTNSQHHDPFNATNEAFSIPSEASIKVAEQRLQERYLSGPLPNGYKAHEYVNIKLEMLRQQLQNAFEAYSSGNIELVAIPLREDVVAEVEITRWRVGNFGVTSASGAITNDSSSVARASFYLTDGGELTATFNLSGGDFMIVSPGEAPTFAILDLTGKKRITSFD